MSDSTSLRQTFDEVAVLHNEVRPRYPDELFATLLDVTNLTTNATLLEIGAGTGQATMPLAQKGFQVTAVELGSSLAEIAKRGLCHYKNVQKHSLFDTFEALLNTIHYEAAIVGQAP